MCSGLVIADVVGGGGRRRAVVGGRQRPVARAQVVRRRLGLPGAGEDALPVTPHPCYCCNQIYYIKQYCIFFVSGIPLLFIAVFASWSFKEFFAQFSRHCLFSGRTQTCTLSCLFVSKLKYFIPPSGIRIHNYRIYSQTLTHCSTTSLFIVDIYHANYIRTKEPVPSKQDFQYSVCSGSPSKQTTMLI